MEILLNILLPVFGIIAFGYGAARAGWFPEAAEKGVATFVFNFAVPLMLFRTIGTTVLPVEVPWGLFGSFYGAGLIIFASGFLAARYAFGRSFSGQAITGMGFAFGNSVLIGLPLVITAYGEAKIVPFLILLSVHGVTFFSITTILLELGAKKEGGGLLPVAGRIARNLALNPVLIGIAAGLFCNLSGIGIADPLEALARLMQGAVAPSALFVAGAAMVRYGIAGRMGQSFVMVGAKLIAFPALVFLAGRYLFGLDALSLQLAILLAAQPVGVMVFVFATRYGIGQAMATTAIFLSTPISAVTLWAILYIFDVR